MPVKQQTLFYNKLDGKGLNISKYVKTNKAVAIIFNQIASIIFFFEINIVIGNIKTAIEAVPGIDFSSGLQANKYRQTAVKSIYVAIKVILYFICNIQYFGN